MSNSNNNLFVVSYHFWMVTLVTMGNVKIKSTRSRFSDSHLWFLFVCNWLQRQIQALNFSDCIDLKLFPCLRKQYPFRTSQKRIKHHVLTIWLLKFKPLFLSCKWRIRDVSIIIVSKHLITKRVKIKPIRNGRGHFMVNIMSCLDSVFSVIIIPW